MTAALSLDDEHQLLDVARAAAGAYLRRHPGLAHNADDILSDACFGAASAAGRHDPAVAHPGDRSSPSAPPARSPTASVTAPR
jgi:hypothetical protein